MRTLLATFSCAAALLSAAPPAYQTSFFFEPNRGQAPAAVRFLASGGGLTVLVEDHSIATSHIRMTIEGGLVPTRVTGVEPLPGVSNYLHRRPYVTDVPHFAAVRLDQVYPGIDMIYKADQSQFEYDFHVAPGADPAAIRLQFSKKPRLSPEGDLLLDTPEGLLRQHRPVAFQTIDGKRVEVPVRFYLSGARVTFSLASYDHSRELVIDPPITYLTYLSHTSGSTNAQSSAISADGSGALYFFSPRGLSVQTGQVGSIGAENSHLTVTKFGPTGQIVYSTVLDISTEGKVNAVDSSGFVYAAGRGMVANKDAPILLKLNQAGNGLVFRNPIAFTDVNPRSLAVDSASNIYMTSQGSNFNPNAGVNPLTATPAALFTSPQSGALLKFDATGLNTVYRTFVPIGSRGLLAVDSNGAAYIYSDNLKILEGVNNFLFPFGSAFVKINPAGTQREYLFPFSFSNFNAYPATPTAIAVNAAKELVFSGFVTAVTPGAPTFPVVNAIQPASGGGTDAFVGKLNAAGTAIVFATHFGGSGQDLSNQTGGLALDPSGDIWFGGTTSSANLPLVGATQSNLLGASDGFLTQLKGDGTAILFSTYVGSTAAEDFPASAAGIAADGGGAYITLAAPSGTLASVNGVQPNFISSGSGTRNYIIGKWGTTAPPNAAPTVTSSAPAFGTGSSTTRTFVFTDSNGAADLGVVNVLINSALDGRNACYLAFDSVNNVLVLLRNNGTDADVLALPSNATLSNSQCSIAGSSITAVKAANTLTLTLTFNFTAAFNATRILYAAARDAVSANSGWQPVGTQTVALPTTNPQPLGTTPNSGTATVGTTYTITTQYRDATNSLNLQPTQLLINDALTGFNACYLAFVHTTNFLYIVNDTTGDLQPTPIRLNGELGGAASIENTQCRVISAGSTFSDSGTTLTTTLQIQFKSGFVGRRLLFAGAQTLAGANSGWSVLGSVNVQ